MFIHPEEDYDFVVKLQPAVLPRYFQNVTANSSIWADKHAYGSSADGEVSLRPGFDPVEAYVDDLTVCKCASSVTVLITHKLEVAYLC
jgi:U3 small nucleolar RNA-associated protein 22